MKNNDDARLLAQKRRVDDERRERAIAREAQATLRRITPGVATPATVRAQQSAQRLRRP